MWNDGRRFSGRVALGFGREGASVVLGYRSSRDSAESVASEIAAVGGSASVVQPDVTDQTSVDGSSPRRTPRTGGSTCS